MACPTALEHACMYGWWMAGWLAGWMDGWMDGFRQIAVSLPGSMYVCMDGWMNE